MTTRQEIVVIARQWIDTPWHHHEMKRGVGVDCVRLLEGIGREAGLIPRDFVMPEYGPNPDGVTLMAMCDKHLVRIDPERRDIGDVIVVKNDDALRPHHVGLLANYRHGGFSIIHACNMPSVRPARVIETRLMFSRTMRLRAAYQFPGVA